MYKPYLCLTAAILALNSLRWIAGDWGRSEIIYSVGFFISCVPLIRYLKKANDELPFFPVISFIYGIYYFMLGLIPFEPYYTVAEVPEQSLFWAAIYSLIGIVFMQLGYLSVIAKSPDTVFKNRDLTNVASTRLTLIGIVGVVGWFLVFIKLVPLAFQMFVTLTSELLIFSFSALFYLQLKNRINKKFIIINWCCFLPIILFTTLATSLLYPLLRIVLLSILIYLYINRKIPWGKLILVSGILVPIFFLKISFRQIEAASNKEKFSGISQMADRVGLYKDAGNLLIEGMDSEVLLATYNSTASRFDLTHMFGFVVDAAPNQVPYLHGKSYQNLIWKPIPRFLYPSKPKENWGNEIGHKFGWLGEGDDDTSVNMPQMIELYLNFGGFGVAFGMFVIGAIYAGLIRFLYSARQPVEGLVTLFLLSSLFNVESNFSLVFGGLPYTVLFLGILLKKILIPVTKIEVPQALVS